MENGLSSIQPHTINLGRVNIVNTVNISGRIVDWKNQQGINQTVVQCIYEDGTFQETKSDATGFFQFDIPNGSTVELRPSKNTNLANGISSFGLGILREFIVANNPPEITSPYQIIAGNYDCWTTESVGLLDMLNFQKVLIGLTTEMDACESWSFLDATTPLPPNFGLGNVFEAFDYPTSIKLEQVSNDQIVEFTGVKMGDILGDATLSDAFRGKATERQKKQQLFLNTPTLTVPKETIVDLPFASNQFKEILSFQAGLSYNSQQLELVAVVPTRNTDFASMLWNTIPTKGQIKLSWISPENNGSSTEKNQPIFSLKFKTKKAINAYDWEQLIQLEERVLAAEIVDIRRTPKAVELNFLTPLSTVTKKIELYKSFPNPTKKEATIGFYLPEAMEASIRLSNHLGQTIKLINQHYTKGYNEVNLSVDGFESGLYFYTLQTASIQTTKSMVVIK